MKFSVNTKYYFFSIVFGLIFWLVLSLLNVEFINAIFFTMAYIWHFAFLAPEMKDYALKSKNKFSLLTVVFKLNFYLQMFIRYEAFPYTSSFVRAVSPLLFTFVLYLFGGSGNLLFAFLGSIVFELVYFNVLKKIISKKDDGEIHRVFQHEESDREPAQNYDNHQNNSEKEI